jgi:hypothetical protein
MADAIQQADQEVLGKIKRHSGFGMAAGIGIAIAGLVAIFSPLVGGSTVPVLGSADVASPIHHPARES